MIIESLICVCTACLIEQSGLGLHCSSRFTILAPGGSLDPDNTAHQDSVYFDCLKEPFDLGLHCWSCVEHCIPRSAQ